MCNYTCYREILCIFSFQSLHNKFQHSSPFHFEFPSLHNNFTFNWWRSALVPDKHCRTAPCPCLVRCPATSQSLPNITRCEMFAVDHRWLLVYLIHIIIIIQFLVLCNITNTLNYIMTGLQNRILVRLLVTKATSVAQFEIGPCQNLNWNGFRFERHVYI